MTRCQALSANLPKVVYLEIPEIRVWYGTAPVCLIEDTARASTTVHPPA